MGQTCIKYVSDESESGSIIEFDSTRRKVVCYHSVPWYKRLFIKKNNHLPITTIHENDDDESKYNISYTTNGAHHMFQFYDDPNYTDVSGNFIDDDIGINIYKYKYPNNPNNPNNTNMVQSFDFTPYKDL